MAPTMKKAFSLDDFQGLSKKKIWRLASLFMSEFFATGIMVFLLCSAVQGYFLSKAQEYLIVGITTGFAVATSVFLFGHVSGAHINPALSLAAVVLGELSIAMFFFYLIAQCVGATFGYSLTRTILPSSAVNTSSNLADDIRNAQFCCSVPDAKLESSQVILVEIIGTAILGWAFCSALDSRNVNKHDSLPLKFGVLMIALALPLALYSGCSVNPARSFGPAFYNQHWNKHWIYWVGPMAGSLFATVSYRIFFDKSITELPTTGT